METATAKQTLRFRPIDKADIPYISRLLSRANSSRACDMTIGGIFLWIDYFRYHAAIVDNTLFIKGVTEDNISIPAFSVPVGDMPLEESVEMLREYCRSHDMQLRFSAVPEETLPRLAAMAGSRVDELSDFADYIYDIESLATLTGKQMSKKRNHVNRFMADNPDYTFEPIGPDNIGAVKEFLKSRPMFKDSPSAVYETMMTSDLLDHLEDFPFESRALSVPGKGVVAFTVGEICGDTLHVHIEKMDHTVDGAGETVNKLFAAEMFGQHPELRYVNRQDDAGDPGLRRAKQSYHPKMMLRKYNVSF